jgi:hypothetical protein
MEPLIEPVSMAWSFPFMPQDWEHTPTAVQAYVHTLHNALTQLRERVEALEARLTQIPRPPTGRRRRTRHTRSLASVRAPPPLVKRAGNQAIRAIARSLGSKPIDLLRAPYPHGPELGRAPTG